MPSLRIAGFALLIAAIGAALALLTGHARWIELPWLSIAASLFVIVVSRLWPIGLSRERTVGTIETRRR